MNSKVNRLKKAIFDSCDDAGFSTLRFDDSVNAYLDAGGDPNLTEPHFDASLLTMAVFHGRESLITRLLDLRADPNIVDRYYHSALHAAVVWKWRCPGSHIHIQLLEAGADVNIFAGGQTPLHLAASRGLTEMAKFLVDAGADLHAKDHQDKIPYDSASDVREYLRDAMARKGEQTT